MAENTSQSYANHARIVPIYHYATSLVLVVNLVYQIILLVRTPSFDSGLGLAMALAFISMYWYLRIFPLAAQDRVIRLEMQLRLDRVLDDPLKTRVGELTPRQLIALRFAGDDELPGLVEEVLDGKLVKGSEIKRKIQSWQADHLRV